MMLIKKNNLERNNSNKASYDMKARVLEVIKKKKIKMRSPFVFLAQRLGLESILASVIIFGALFVSVIFYFLKKAQALKFLSLGFPGLKVFILALPYDCIALFIITLSLAIYLANKIALFCGNCENTEKFAVYFFLITVILGLCFAIMGVGDFLMQNG